MCQLEGFCTPGNVHFVINIFVLDICCQHLGKIFQLEGFCAPFGRKVKECTFCNLYISIYICIGYMLPKFWEHMSGEFLHCSHAKLSGAQLSTFFRADSWAPDSRAPGPNSLGPNCPGPNCPGPNSPRTQFSDAINFQLFCFPACHPVCCYKCWYILPPSPKVVKRSIW